MLRAADHVLRVADRRAGSHLRHGTSPQQRARRRRQAGASDRGRRPGPSHPGMWLGAAGGDRVAPGRARIHQ
eukprot:15006885-Heterocapsa_arctica.AAC.1